jgi:hypothetical protein
MMPERLSFAAVIILVISTFVLLLSQNWRWSIFALAFQYLAVFGLILLVWPVGLAAVKLVSGWMAGAILTASQPGPHLIRDVSPRSSAFLFRLLIALLVWILVISLTPLVLQWIPLPPALVLGSMLLVGMGLLQLGITTRPLRVLVGLLTTLSGFELIYAAVESSVLVAGLLAVVTLGLALVGSYLFEILSVGKEAG